MRFKRFSAMLLALAMCMGVFSTTVFAYSDESGTTTTTEKAETVETVPEKTEDKTSEEVPYTVTVNEDGTVVFSFNGKEWTYGAEESEDNNMGTGKVVTSGSRLNVRTGAGMNYEIIDQLRPHIRDISTRTYYRKRKEAVEVLSSVLWGYTAQDSAEIVRKFLQ